MKDLIIISDKPITYESISDLIKNEFKAYQLLNDTPDLIYMKKGRLGFELELSPNDILDDPESDMEDVIDKCPNKKGYLTNLSYTNCKVSKRILNIIKDMFGNMWIQSDEYDDWFGTVGEYIDNYKDEVFPWQRSNLK